MSIIHPHIDTILIKYLDIDDLRSLYQVNRHYRNLLKDKLTNFIDFYSKVNDIKLPIWIECKTLFNKAIIFDKLDVCQYIQHKYNIDIHKNNNESFKLCCTDNHLEIAKWLFSFGNIDIHANNEYAFELCSIRGYFEIAQWLYSLGNVNIHVDDEYAFRSSCKYNYIAMAKWLCSIESRYHIQIVDDKIVNYNIS